MGKDDHHNTFELIQQSQWNGTLIECGLRESCVLYFSSRALPPRHPKVNPGFNEAKGNTGNRIGIDPVPAGPSQNPSHYGVGNKGLNSPDKSGNAMQHGHAGADKVK